MSITFACGHCGKTFTIEDKFAGKKGKCKQCGSVMQIPGAVSAPNPAPNPVQREISPSRRPPASAPSTSPRPEISPSRRAPSPVEARPDDVYGFEENPRTGPSAVMNLDEDDFESAAEEKPLSRAGYYEPPKAKKKKKKKNSGEEPAAMLVGRIILGLAIGSAGTYASAIFIAGLVKGGVPNVNSGRALESILKQRFTLNQEGLMGLLTKVTDVPSAQKASGPVNSKVRAISANLRLLRTSRFPKTEVDSLTQQYGPVLDDSTKLWVQEFFRIAAIPGAWDALNTQTAMDELDREEKAAGLKQLDVSNIQVPPPGNPTFTPPTPPTPPKMPTGPTGPRNQNKANRNRGGIPRVGPGGQGGPG